MENLRSPADLLVNGFTDKHAYLTKSATPSPMKSGESKRLLNQGDDPYALRPDDELYREEVAIAADLPKLIYYANAGFPEARLIYAKLCYYGRYVPEDKHTAYAQISALLKSLGDLPKPQAQQFIQTHFAAKDTFIWDVINYREKHQFGSEHGRKWWIFLNQTRLNLTRLSLVISFTLAAKASLLDEIRRHPAWGSGAFSFFFLRMSYDTYLLFSGLRRDKEKRAARTRLLWEAKKKEWAANRGPGDEQELHPSWMDKTAGTREWLKRFMTKGNRHYRFTNDIVWFCLGLYGFVLDMVAIGDFFTAVPLVVGFLFDVVVEVVRLLDMMSKMRKEVSLLRLEIQKYDLQIQTLSQDIESKQTELARITLRLEENEEEPPRIKELQAEIQAQEQTRIRSERERQLLCNRVKTIQNNKSTEIIKQTVNIAATFLLFTGMFVARILPLVTSLSPMAGAILVLTVSLAWLGYKIGEAVYAYRKQGLKQSISTAKNIAVSLDLARPQGEFPHMKAPKQKPLGWLRSKKDQFKDPHEERIEEPLLESRVALMN